MRRRARQPGKWRWAGLFLLIALPGLMVVWWFTLREEAADYTRGEMAYLAVPVLAAALVGALWRGTLPALPNWATRRPYSRLMAYLLFAAVIAPLPIAMVSLAVIANGHTLTNTWPAILSAVGGTFPRALPDLFLSLARSFLLCLIQADIGLSLGVWLRDWMISRAPTRI